MKNSMTAGKILEIGGPDKMTYEQLMRLYSSILHRNVNIIQIPFLTPRLSSYWIDLITPVKASLARPLVDSLVHDSYVRDNSIDELVSVNLIHMTEAIKEAREEAKSFEPIIKIPEEKTSYKVNQKILLVSLIAMAVIGSSYYWMDDRTDVWEAPWIFGSLIWYVAILFAISFVNKKARLGYLIGGVLAWITMAFWLFDNFYVVFQISLIGTQPNLDVTVRNFIGVAVAGLSIFASHNVFHKVRVLSSKRRTSIRISCCRGSKWCKTCIYYRFFIMKKINFKNFLIFLIQSSEFHRYQVIYMVNYFLHMPDHFLYP